jgi:hypothetical protein
VHTIAPSWPFAIWGLDAVGPFRTAPGGYNEDQEHPGGRWMTAPQ